MIEVHNDPEKALCDGAQSLTPQMFDTLMKKIQRTVDFFRILDRYPIKTAMTVPIGGCHSCFCRFCFPIHNGCVGIGSGA